MPVKDGNEEQEVFRGHLKECLAHLAGRFALAVPKNSKRANTAKRPIAEFCHVGIASVARWFRNPESPPHGETLFRLICYMDMLGYRIIEFERMDRYRRNFMKLVGYGVLSGKEAADALGYASTNRLYQMAHKTDSSIGKEKKDKMWEIWKERKKALEQEEERARKVYALGISLIGEPAKQPAAPAAAETRTPNSRCEAAVNIMRGLLALLEEQPFSNLSNGGAAQLRRAGGSVVLKLSARLNTVSAKLVESSERGDAP